MSYRRQDWPLEIDQLRRTIAQGEETLVEFKRAWWGSDAPDAKGTIARGIIALANAVGPDDLGLMLIGVEDERRGGGIYPQTSIPDPEAVTQVMQTYIHPPANIQCRHVKLPEGVISAIGVFHSPNRPHYPVRDHSPILSTKDVYIRRDRQVGVMTLPELERMIRDKNAPLSNRANYPLQFGVIATDRSYPPAVLFRVRSVVTEPTSDVSVVLDAFLLRDRAICGRSPLIVGATLAPGESRELTVRLADVQVFRTSYEGTPPRIQVSPHREQSLVSDRWLDLVFRVSFRDSEGLVQQYEVQYAAHW